MLICRSEITIRRNKFFWHVLTNFLIFEKLLNVSESEFSGIKWKEVLVTQLCPTLCDPVDCSPLGCSVYGRLQARILEWVAILFSKGSS